MEGFKTEVKCSYSEILNDGVTPHSAQSTQIGLEHLNQGKQEVWCASVIPILKKPRREYRDVKASLSYLS